METEVSCLRRRLAENDRGKKSLSCVCVCVRVCTGVVVRVFVSGGGGHSRVLPQETSAVTEVRPKPFSRVAKSASNLQMSEVVDVFTVCKEPG